MGNPAAFEQIYKVLPDYEGKLHLKQVYYDPQDQSVLVSLTSDVLVGTQQFAQMQKAFKRMFPKLRLSLRIASPQLADDFLRDPQKYAPVITPILLKTYPAMTSYIDQVRWLSDKNGLLLELPAPFAYEYMDRQDVRQKLGAAIYDLFVIQPSISLRLAHDLESRMEKIRQEREREEQLLAAQAQFKQKTEAEKKDKKILGRAIAAEAVPIKGLDELSGTVVIAGKVVSVDSRKIQRSNSVLLLFTISDNTESILCKVFLGGRQNGYRQEDIQEDPEAEKKKIDAILAQVKPGAGLIVRGQCQQDNFENCLTIMARDISHFDLPKRSDASIRKRIELHAHTHMSEMDGLVSAKELITRAADFGHAAIAITDHAVVQAFPEAFATAKKNKIRLIPGMEATMIDETGIVQSPSNVPIHDAIVVLDFETTGLNPKADRIIEIGAVRLQNGQIMETFSSLVNPLMPLDQKVIQITGIKDYMLQDQPTAEQILPQLMDFIGSSPLAAHNAAFDVAFLRAELARIGREMKLPRLDTLAFAQKLYPNLKSYSLKNLCRHLGVSLKNAHRAVADATATANCLSKMLTESEEKGVKTLQDINELITGYNRNIRHHITILVASQPGMRNINHLVSLSHMQYFHHEPLVPRDLIVQNREGLLLGSSCIKGELYQAALEGKSTKRLEEIARFYDFIEVQPAENYTHLVEEGRISSLDVVREASNKLISLGQSLGLPVVASGDVHFLDKEDAIYRSIIKSSIKGSRENPDTLPDLHFRTTGEMLEAFAYLGQEAAEKLVIDGPAQVLSLTEPVSLYPIHPEGKTTFSPHWEHAAEDITSMSWAEAERRYGKPLPKLVSDRLDKELAAITGYGYATLYAIAQKLVKKSQEDGYMVGSRGSVGSSFVATMCGITEVNPLPPHYLCAACSISDFDVPSGAETGPDLPDRDCPGCGKRYAKDGYEIPFEVFLGFEGDKVPDIDLNFCSEYQSTAHAQVEELFGQGQVFRAGTINTLQEKTSFGYVLGYAEERGLIISPAEKNRLAHGCMGVKRTTGQHPGGMVIVPTEYEAEQFTALQRPANKETASAVITHFDFDSMHDILVKVDVLGHDDPTMMRQLELLSGIGYQEIPLDDPKVISLFRSPEALGLSSHELGWSTGTLGIPESGTNFVRGMLEIAQPASVADLIRISGLSHGTDVWAGNARELIQEGIATLQECICTREDIMQAMLLKGLESKMAFDIMEHVRKGRGLTQAMEEAMRRQGVEDWFINSCKKIAYMFPKGHAVAYMTMALRVGWFKVYHPLVYYAAYFSIRGKGFNALTMTWPTSRIKQDLQTLYDIPIRELSDKQESEISALELVHEMGLRGFSFLPVDLYKSDVNQFLIEGNSLRCPFTSLPGFGESAAQGILQTRDQGYLSIEDLKQKAKVNVNAIEMLRDCGALNGLNDSNQVDFFSFL